MLYSMSVTPSVGTAAATLMERLVGIVLQGMFATLLHAKGTYAHILAEDAFK